MEPTPRGKGASSVIFWKYTPGSHLPATLVSRASIAWLRARGRRPLKKSGIGNENGFYGFDSQWPYTPFQ